MEITNIIFGLAHLLCGSWVLFEIWTRNKNSKISSKILWSIFALLFSIVTAAIYYFEFKKKRKNI
ncbi:hypothetical protein HN789_05980 [archaeon]|jgi:hypothetical protein|nr:hypothetical protein [archaeon]MBT4022318.1 hypothetical protein [archaeon]MBT4273196.1 hypothetical protein [archaeon]MBT4461361.1 hypothetical protein [archaeon]MBT4858895.1 hypothetical protein [archaeon]